MNAREKIAELCWPAFLAESLGQECGVPRGSMWYPGITHGIREKLKGGMSREDIEIGLRFGLGIETELERVGGRTRRRRRVHRR